MVKEIRALFCARMSPALFHGLTCLAIPLQFSVVYTTFISIVALLARKYKRFREILGVAFWFMVPLSP
jgi:hypothetical protein